MRSSFLAWHEQRCQRQRLLKAPAGKIGSMEKEEQILQEFSGRRNLPSLDIFVLEGIVVNLNPCLLVEESSTFLAQELSSFRSYQLKWFVRLNHTNPKMKSIIFQSGSRRLCFSNRNSSLIQWNCPMDVAKASCHFRWGEAQEAYQIPLFGRHWFLKKYHIIYLNYLACDVDVLILKLDLCLLLDMAEAW